MYVDPAFAKTLLCINFTNKLYTISEFLSSKKQVKDLNLTDPEKRIVKYLGIFTTSKARRGPFILFPHLHLFETKIWMWRVVYYQNKKALL